MFAPRCEGLHFREARFPSAGFARASILVSIGLFSIPAISRAQVVASTPALVNAGQGDFAGLVEIGKGRRLYLECRGTGSPTVILESGFRNTATIWTISDNVDQRPVFDQVAEFTRVCAYDRPGTTLSDNQFSRSDPVPMPRTLPEIVSDLHALLSAARIPGPYVLTAHSLGWDDGQNVHGHLSLLGRGLDLG